MITITLREYNELCNDSDFLNCLTECGVDNWEGYSEACSMMDEDED